MEAYVLMTKDRTKIGCGGRKFKVPFRKVNNIFQSPVKLFKDKAVAEASLTKTYIAYGKPYFLYEFTGANRDDIEIVKINITFEEVTD